MEYSSRPPIRSLSCGQPSSLVLSDCSCACGSRLGTLSGGRRRLDCSAPQRRDRRRWHIGQREREGDGDEMTSRESACADPRTAWTPAAAAADDDYPAAPVGASLQRTLPQIGLPICL